MSRNLVYVLCMCVLATAMLAVVIFGMGTAVSVMFLGGMDDLITDYQFGIWDMNAIKGIAKVICSGPVALLSVLAIQFLLAARDRLYAWKLGRV